MCLGRQLHTMTVFYIFSRKNSSPHGLYLKPSSLGFQTLKEKCQAYVAKRFVLVKCVKSVANFRNFAPVLTVLKSNEFQSFLRTQSQLSEVPLHGLRENKINLQMWNLIKNYEFTFSSLLRTRLLQLQMQSLRTIS